MTILYLWVVGFPLLGTILKIKKKEFDDPKFFAFIIVWIAACTGLWFYMGWFSLESSPGSYDPDWIRK
tara:strand:+ start:612 stop:815 length:204 start_codon:yes stop_codon:yes gene_type:complete